MRALILFVVLLSALASAQVAGACGPGKACQVATLRTATSGTARPAAQCMYNTAQPGYSWGWAHATSNITFGAWFGNVCSGSQATSVGRLNFSLNSAAVATVGTSYFLSFYGYESGLAFASFPSCVAGNVGRLIFDATNNVWRYCDGGGTWRYLTYDSANAVSAPSSAWTAISDFSAVAASEDVNFYGPYTPSKSNARIGRVTCNWVTAGTGGATGVRVRIYDLTAGAEVCKCTVGACTTASRTPVGCDCNSSALTSGNQLVMRLETGTDCTANPQQVVCTAEVTGT